MYPNNYRVLILKNDRLDTKTAYIQAKKYFADKKMDVSYFTKDVNELTSVHEYKKVQGFNWKTGEPALISYKGLDDIVKDNCRKYVKEGEYDHVMFCWDKTEQDKYLTGTEVITSWNNLKPLYPTTGFSQLAINQWVIDNDKLWHRITHEQMHEFPRNLKAKGCPVIDVMDSAPDNDNPYSPTGNYTQTFNSIKPYLHLLTKQVVTIKRNKDTGVETLGDLSFGDFKCKTLERPWKNNQSNISCIPKGTYECVYSFSPKFMKYTYRLLNVPKRSGILIHSGNYFFDIQGCILLGTGYANLNNDKEVDIINSRLTIKKFEELLGKQSFTLQII